MRLARDVETDSGAKRDVADSRRRFEHVDDGERVGYCSYDWPTHTVKCYLCGYTPPSAADHAIGRVCDPSFSPQQPIGHRPSGLFMARGHRCRRSGTFSLCCRANGERRIGVGCRSPRSDCRFVFNHGLYNLGWRECDPT